MNDIVRFSVSVEWDLLKKFDDSIKKSGYENRSMAIRDLFKDFIYAKNMQENSQKDSVFLIISLSNRPIKMPDNVYMHMSAHMENDKFINMGILKDNIINAKNVFSKFKLQNNIEYTQLLPIGFKNND